MKKIIATLFTISAFISTGYSQSGTEKAENVDTIEIRKQIYEGGIFRVEVNSHKTNKDTSEKKEMAISMGCGSGTNKGTEFIETEWLLMNIGFNNYLQNGGFEIASPYNQMELRGGKSINFHLGIVQQGLNLYRKKLRLVYGIGIDFNNYRFSENILLTPKAEPLIVKQDTMIKYEKIKLATQYLTIPLLLQFNSNPSNTDESFKFSAGFNFGYLIKSYTKQVWEDEGKRKSKTFDDFALNPVRYGPAIEIGYGNFRIYGNYMLNGMFKPGKGPELHSFSAGIVLNGFL